VTDPDAQLPVESHHDSKLIVARPGLNLERYHWGLGRATMRILFGPEIAPEFGNIPSTPLPGLPDLTGSRSHASSRISRPGRGACVPNGAAVAKPRLGLGTYGEIRPYRTPRGWRVEAYFRDMDGVTRLVKRSGKTKSQAAQRLKDDLRKRQYRSSEELSRDSTFAEVAELWLAEVKRKRRGVPTTDTAPACETRSLPALGQLRLHECAVRVFDSYLTSLEGGSSRTPFVHTGQCCPG
jgi:hypothetical protein